MNTNIFGMFYLTRIQTIRIYLGSYSGPNTNTNIVEMIKWTEYRIIEYFWLEYSNII